MYKVIMQYEDKSPSIVNEFKTLKEATECLNRITQTAEKDHCIITKTDKYRYTIQDNLALTFDEIWIEKDDKNKSQNNQQLTLFTNNQNQTIMASPKQIVIGHKRDGSPVYSSGVVSPQYRNKGTKNGKPAMVVPVNFVTLPENFYTHARKYQELQPYQGKRQFATYVIGCTFTKNNKKLYVVARLTYMGGKPAIATTHYRGYSKRTAWIVFHAIPYTEMRMTDKNGNDVRTKSDGSYRAVIEENNQRRNAFRQNRENNNPYSSPRF